MLRTLDVPLARRQSLRRFAKLAKFDQHVVAIIVLRIAANLARDLIDELTYSLPGQIQFVNSGRRPIMSGGVCQAILVPASCTSVAAIASARLRSNSTIVCSGNSKRLPSFRRSLNTESGCRAWR